MSTPTYAMLVEVLEGKNLIAADSNGLSDPYVKVSIGGTTRGKTKIVPKTLNPQWGETMPLPVKNPSSDVVRFDVYDHDTFKPDDKLGYANFCVSSLVKGVAHEVWLPLEGVPSGSIRVVFTAINFGLPPPAPAGNDPARGAATLSSAPPPGGRRPSTGPPPGLDQTQYYVMPAHPDAVPAIMESSGKAPAAKIKEAAHAPSPSPAASATLEPQRVSSPGRKSTPDVITKQQPLIDDFEVGRELGHGSFAVVREGIRKSDGQKVAIKTIPKEKLTGPNEKNLRREICNLASLDHPNVMKLYEVYEEARFFHLILEYIKGTEMFDKVANLGAYTEKDAANVMRQVLSAVAYLHEHGIAHRDLKPENLISIGSGEHEVVKIADFGLSKNFEEGELMTACGSPLYLAPEILMAEPYDKAVDIWSLGVILYILLVGYPPFDATVQSTLFRSIMTGNWHFGPGWEKVSEDAKDLVHRMMTRDPKRRITAREALEHAWIKYGGTRGGHSLDNDKLRALQASRRR